MKDDDISPSSPGRFRLLLNGKDEAIHPVSVKLKISNKNCVACDSNENGTDRKHRYTIGHASNWEPTVKC